MANDEAEHVRDEHVDSAVATKSRKPSEVSRMLLAVAESIYSSAHAICVPLIPICTDQRLRSGLLPYRL